MTQELYQRLIETKLVGAKGYTTFKLNGKETIINDSSVVGNLIQEWLKTFMDQEGITYRTNPNTQEPPDFFMDKTSNITNLLEVKCFKKSPNFDVANVSSYVRGLLLNPHRLNSDYLIIQYKQNPKDIEILNLWLKKVWEITGPSDRYPLKLQVKKGVIYNIRPNVWYSNRTTYKPYNNYHELLDSLQKIINTTPQLHDLTKNWSKLVTEGFENHLRLIKS
jgi:NgoBV restriction endonuclease